MNARSFRSSSAAWNRLGLCLSALLFASVGCSPAGPAPGTPAASTPGKEAPTAGTRRLILLTNGDSPFWDACRAGMKDAERDLKLEAEGYQAVLDVNNGTLAGQLEKLRQYASQSDIAGVAISAIDAENAAVADEMTKLKEKGLAVITIDSDVDRKKFRGSRSAFVGTDNHRGGLELGLCAKQLLPEGGKYVTFVGLTGAQNARDRIVGFAKGAGEKVQALDSMADDFDRSKARENVRNAIANHPDMNLVVGIYSYNAPAIVDVVKELDKRAALKVIAFDAEPLAIKHMAEGQIDAMIVQNPYNMGYFGIKLMKALAEDDATTLAELLPDLKQPEGDIYNTGLKVVVPDAKSPIQQKGFDSATQFLTFDEFKEWLKKYKLTGS